MATEENVAVIEEEEESESEYESDPEETALSLSMRRRVASDDDDEDDSEEQERERATRLSVDPRVEIGSDGELEGQGGVAVYDDDDENSEIDEVEEEEVQQVVVEEESRGESEIRVVGEVGEGVGGEEGERSGNVEETGGESNEVEGEKKENEPFAVPTAGAFYMHDDRFRENVGGRNNRRTLGGRKLWESKDDRKWGHDKFEELSVQERQYDKEGRNSRGPPRGRGKNRGTERRQARGNRPRAYEGRNQAHNQAQNQGVKSVRGRGPRRYEPTNNDVRETHTQHKQAGRFQESTSNASSGRQPTNARISNAQSDSAPPRNNVFASSLSSASPPFYPSSTSNQNVAQTQRRELPGGNANKNSRPSVSENRNSTSHSTLQRGKNVADAADKRYYEDVPQSFYGKFNNLQLQSSGPLPTITTQYSQNNSKGRGIANPEQSSYQSSPSFSQTSKVSQQTQSSAFHQRPVQNAVQPSYRVSSQQLGQHSNSVSRASSPPKASPTSSSEHGDVESPPGSSKSKTLVAKGKSSIQGNGRGAFLYNGAQVMGASGAMGVSHSDQNFPATPALLQVMQFGGQHPGGLGVPAVGMALPGYVAQPQLGGGFGNSEMTWVPVLAGAAGALGASYPYLVDGAYYSRPSGQTSSSSGVSSKESSTGKPNNALKPAQRSELVTDEFGQRRNKARRYSEMNIGK